jgi:hypothetical protein
MREFAKYILEQADGGQDLYGAALSMVDLIETCRLL